MSPKSIKQSGPSKAQQVIEANTKRQIQLARRRLQSPGRKRRFAVFCHSQWEKHGIQPLKVTLSANRDWAASGEVGSSSFPTLMPVSYSDTMERATKVVAAKRQLLLETLARYAEELNARIRILLKAANP